VWQVLQLTCPFIHFHAGKVRSMQREQGYQQDWQPMVQELVQELGAAAEVVMAYDDGGRIKWGNPALKRLLDCCSGWRHQRVHSHTSAIQLPKPGKLQIVCAH
jgi:hypothetical protein